MKNINTKVTCTKQVFSKHQSVCKTYSPIQAAYAKILEDDPDVAKFQTNVKLTDLDFDGATYSTDFLITKTNGDVIVRECIKRTYLMRPKKLQMLDASREYWANHGVTDWGLVIDA